MLNDKQCRSRSVGFFRSQLIWVYTVCKDRVHLGSAGQELSWSWWLTLMCIWMVVRRLRVQSLPGLATSFHRDWSWNIFLDYSLHSAGSRRAGNILSWRLIMKYFPRLFSPFRTFKKGWQHSFMEIDHELFSSVILSILLVQEGQASFFHGNWSWNIF